MILIKVQIDEGEVKQMIQEAIDKRVKELDQDLVFWDMKELRRRTKMSVNTIKEQFFYDEDFPKAKIGSKWYFSAKEAEVFLIEWLETRKR